ncbi:Uncharacterized protein HZ326_28121, partial [Fusarium oxysporum f. sp. albedinis]
MTQGGRVASSVARTDKGSGLAVRRVEHLGARLPPRAYNEALYSLTQATDSDPGLARVPALRGADPEGPDGLSKLFKPVFEVGDASGFPGLTGLLDGLKECLLHVLAASSISGLEAGKPDLSVGDHKYLSIIADSSQIGKISFLYNYDKARKEALTNSNACAGRLFPPSHLFRPQKSSHSVSLRPLVHLCKRGRYLKASPRVLHETLWWGCYSGRSKKRKVTYNGNITQPARTSIRVRKLKLEDLC